MFKNKKIIILQGGYSQERSVSLKTAASMLSCFKENGYEDVSCIDIQADKLSTFVEQILEQKPFVLVNALHGEFGEDGTLQGCLESLQVPYTGLGVEASAVCMNKYIAKLLLEKQSVATPHSVYLPKGTSMQCALEQLTSISMPCVLKDCHAGSTQNLYIVNNKDEFVECYKKHEHDSKDFLLEQFIKGKELTVSILDNQALPIIEIIPDSGFYDYEAKYVKGKTRFECPAQLTPQLTEKIQSMALKAAQACKANMFCRVDILLDEANKPWVLEINTLPGMTSTSLLPRAAASQGINFIGLLEKMLDLAMQKHALKKSNLLKVGG